MTNGHTQSSESLPVVQLEKVGKRYILHKQKPFLLRELLRPLLIRKSRHQDFWALRDLSLTIKKGESVGVIGSNGAGKSTLLGVIAGAIYPTAGHARIRGRIGALLELGAGFHPDLTGRENVYLNASLLGLTKREVEEQFENILEFSELADFIDIQISKYSSGMHVRLGFSVAVHMRPEILLIDEALSVGDHAFQEKCMDRILSFKNAGKTLLFVSHAPQLIRPLCDRVVWLEHGSVRLDGPPNEVLETYESSNAHF